MLFEPLMLCALRPSGENDSNVLERARLVVLTKDRSSSSAESKYRKEHDIISLST